MKPPGRRRFPCQRVGALLAAAGAVALSGCTLEVVTPTAAPSPSATPTRELPLTSLLPTIAEVATETAPPVPTATPDLLRPPEARERIFYDPLDDDLSGWGLTDTAIGSVGFSGGMLVFTFNTSYSKLQSTLPREIPPDAYIEANVQTLLCGEGYDTYGIVFRDQKEYSYRFAVTCRGELRFERLNGGKLEGASIWKETIGLLQGAPASNRIGVLVQGSLFRFFVGGIEVFSGRDPMSSTGGVGLFAQTEKSKTFSVGFEDLAVYNLAESSA
jgi:hypothetical protein